MYGNAAVFCLIFDYRGLFIGGVFLIEECLHGLFRGLRSLCRAFLQRREGLFRRILLGGRRFLLLGSLGTQGDIAAGGIRVLLCVITGIIVVLFLDVVLLSVLLVDVVIDSGGCGTNRSGEQ